MIIKRLYQKLQKKYRIAFIDHDSLSQSRMFIMKPLTGLAIFSLFSALFIAGTASLIVLTPFIRETIPGYKRPELEEKYKKTQELVIELNRQVEARDALLESLNEVHGEGNMADMGGSLSKIENPMEDPVVNSYDYPERNQVEPNRQEPAAESNSGSLSGNFQGAREVQGVMNLMKPVSGIITSAFNPDDKHFGVDLVADDKAIIHSVADGFVIFSEYSAQTGYVVGISHGNLISFYKHNSRVFKKVGSYVFEGEAIAVIGNSGENSTGPHLHFELWYNGKPVNPAEYIDLF